jgi:hypothetical protein
VPEIYNGRTGGARIGDVNLRCRPQATVGPKETVNKAVEADVTEGPVVELYKNHGNAILVKIRKPQKDQNRLRPGASRRGREGKQDAAANRRTRVVDGSVGFRGI